MFGKDSRQVIKFLELLVLGMISGQFEHGLPARLFREVAQEQSIVAPIFHVRRE